MDQRREFVRSFGEALVHAVRDRAVRSCDLALAHGRQVDSGSDWRTLDDSSKALIAAAIPTIVDITLSRLLAAIDGGDLDVAWAPSEGEFVSLFEAGKCELQGWFVGEDGWRDWFSQERYWSFDPLAADEAPVD